MLSRLVHRLVACAALLGILGGCDLVEPREENLILHVAPETVECVGAMPQRCLVVREHGEQDWSFWYDGIAGFTHQQGFRYTLYVTRHRIDNPPADGSSVEYRLIRILAQEPGPAD